jgi:hypothetical protein
VHVGRIGALVEAGQIIGSNAATSAEQGINVEFVNLTRGSMIPSPGVG